MRTLARKRRCGCGCRLAPGTRRPRRLDAFRGLGLAAILCWQAISFLVRLAGRSFKDWAGGDWHGLDASVHADEWKCDLCGAVGMGDANSFFALSEIDHFLEARCRGSLRPHDGLAALKALAASLEVKVREAEDELMRKRIAAGVLARQEETGLDALKLSASSYAQEEKRLGIQTTTCLGRTLSPSIVRGIGNITVGCNAWLAIPAPPPEQETARQVALGLGSTWVEAGQTLHVNAGTREAFQVRRMIVPTSASEHFMIEGLMIGRRQLLRSRVPAMFFTEASPEITFFDGQVEPPGLITVSVTNMSRKGRWFQGALAGPAIDDPADAPPASAADALELMRRRVEEGVALRGGSSIAAQELEVLLRETES